MKHDPRWKIPLSATLGALVIYSVFPLLVQGMDSLLRFILGGIFILSALPQMLWWAAGVTVLTFWGLRILINLVTRKSPEPYEKGGQAEDQNYRGRLRVIYQRLLGASSGRYYQEEARNILRSLAVDWIALKLDISEEEARERFLQGNWTEDRTLKAYFFEDPPWGREKQGFWRRFRRFKRKENRTFLEETEKALDRLKSYGKL